MFKQKKINEQKTYDRSNILTSGQIGRTREVTPEKYLLCRDVRLARTGILVYGDGEVPVKPDHTGLIQVYRGNDVLFSPTTISSTEGKPITDDHPDDWVTPDNWKDLAKGTAHNIHQGNGEDAEYLIGDLLVMDQSAIDAVQGGKVEISLGYDAHYTEISPGKGVQSNIVVNHIALVDKGRCGSQCSIGDSFMSKKTQKAPWYQALLGAKKTIDEALENTKPTEDDESEETKDDDEESGTNTGDSVINRQILKTLKTLDSRLGVLEKKTKDTENEETEDEDDEPTQDDILKAEAAAKLSEEGVRNHTGDSLKEVISRVEILSPGYRIPTFDSANNGKAVQNTKRSVLKTAYATQDGQIAIAPFVGANPDFDKLPAHTIDAAFVGASELIKQINNSKGVRSGVLTKDFGRTAPSIADINAKNRAYWNKGK
ncbi:DUF2213 domain-containing protein [Acinetobacter sp.]|jgi:hypothetical protein|uniref:DUF2213 domain-containing protein n=1 Tax=Acinetobacter sp. TaxID=472 RepID=UPI00283219D7|nr:DUF2213 domain-containing protein [Acinetobacter sp.]MDR0238129.1 DUF2213 domain-containing protein [Acinetobacter sp.]